VGGNRGEKWVKPDDKKLGQKTRQKRGRKARTKSEDEKRGLTVRAKTEKDESEGEKRG
jgi:hypothetical protein